ncbi:MAG: hypothetical protein MZV65_44110 [Chromatiales bacterium]|nr:hypothetical protein [Chromatiales bacterium]
MTQALDRVGRRDRTCARERAGSASSGVPPGRPRRVRRQARFLQSRGFCRRTILRQILRESRMMGDNHEPAAGHAG